MTDNEIIKALECCGRENCNGCPYRTDKLCHQGNPMIRDACDLIKCQKAEIQDLEIKNEHLVCFLAEARKDAIKEFAERLKKDLCDLEFNANTERKTIRVSELREQVDWVLHTVFIEIIDNRANEMTREQGNDRLPVDKKNGSRN